MSAKESRAHALNERMRRVVEKGFWAGVKVFGQVWGLYAKPGAGEAAAGADLAQVSVH